MTFYERQHQAKRKTWLLLSYFMLAVLFIVVAVNTVIYFTLFFSDTHKVLSLRQWITSPMCWTVAAVTVIVITGGSLFRYTKIRQGGDAIAIWAGGRLVSRQTENTLEKRLLNIAEEMAIASGTHIPRVYLLEEEPGINAFVAGYSANNTILAVTQGALENLSRDELQGVIGHEYSHILNSDTRINLNLMSILAGILLIGQIGDSLLRSTSRRHTYSRRDKNSGGQLILGLALMLIGYVGLFFGRLIKAAVSRQREFLADASAVQFTRNPFGIGGALFKIGQIQYGSELNNRHAEEMSHMCFGETIKVSFANLLATHPPIDERLKAIEPSLPVRMRSRLSKGQLTMADESTPFGSQHMGFNPIEAATKSESHNTTSITKGFVPDATDTSTAEKQFKVDKTQIKHSIGTLGTEHVDRANQLILKIPDALILIAHNMVVAECIIYGLVLTTMNSHGKEAIALIKENTNREQSDTTVSVYQRLREQPSEIRLPLLEIAISTLEELQQNDKTRILSLTKALIALDNKFTLYEFIYVSLVAKYLSTEPHSKPLAPIKSYRQVENAVAVLLAGIVLASDSDARTQQEVYLRSLTGFTNKSYEQLLNNPPGVDTLSKAVDLLARLTPLLKQPLIDACVDCILHDDRITHNEANLLRAICERLDCPMPMLALPAD
ncbi:MAG: M48 family metallopeptidase [Pseudomonadales bacterium]|nr:M48 family metallopeptidase [Pseudomonadales bacterium]